MNNNNKYNILIVEDSKSINQMLFSMFVELNYNCYRAYCLEDANKILHKYDISYLMLDINLPDGSGYELIKKLQSTQCKIFVLTNENDKQFIEMSYQKGVVDYIVKDNVFFHKVKSLSQSIKKLESNKTKNILIVDDSLIIREQLKDIFINRFYNVIAVSTTKEALVQIENKKIDLILLDIELEHENGIDFLKKNKNNLIDIKNIPIIIVSGYIDGYITKQSLKAGAVDVIKKPYVMEEIILKVDLWIDYKRSNENVINLKFQNDLVKQENENFQILLDETMEMIVIFDKEFKIINVNKVALNMLGYKSKYELIGLRFDRFIDEKQLILFYDSIELNHGDKFELFIQNNNSQNIATLCKNKTINFDNQEVYISTMIDITELKNKDKQMIQQNRLAQMGEMISMIAHQWRQPLNALSIINHKLLLKYRTKKLTDDEIKIFQKDSKKQIKQMSSTIDDFRNFFKPNKNLENFDLLDTVNKTLDLFYAIAKNHNIEIKFINNKSAYMNGYANEMGQAIINILNNAKDALIEKDIQNKFIKIDLSSNDDKIILSIEDNAGGISEDNIKNIFDPYFSTKENKNGTGLGLYMTKMIIEDHMKGEIIVNNTKDGVIFTIVFDIK